MGSISSSPKQHRISNTIATIFLLITTFSCLCLTASYYNRISAVEAFALLVLLLITGKHYLLGKQLQRLSPRKQTALYWFDILVIVLALVAPFLAAYAFNQGINGLSD